MNLRFIYAVLAVVLLASATAAAENIFDIEGGDATSVGVYIKDLKTGKVIVDHNSHLALTPASVTKAVTSATALQTLGADWRFSTKVELSGGRATEKGVWRGNIVINASGDPTLESSEFKKNQGFTDSIVSGLRRMGITRIDGTVIIRETMPDAGPVPQWEIEDLAWDYGAGLFGFNYAGNVVRAYPNKGTTVPASNLRITVKPSTDGGTDLLRGINSENLTVWASEKNRSNAGWNISTTIPNPAAVYERLLISRLKSAGIAVGGKRSEADGSATSLYTHYSPRLDSICRNLMKRSDNLFAEGMLRAILPGKSRSDCVKAEKAYWAARGLDSRFNIINDGSGLTRANRISPRFLGDMLEWMATSDNAATYLSFFPVSGIDGTMKSFLAKTRLKGHLAMKTGSVSSVQCYAGYKLGPDGKPTHVVVIMVNGFFCSRNALRKQIENYLLKTF